MEILFMVFMIVVSIMALFAVMVVLRDIVSDVLRARRERESADKSIIQYAEKIIAEANKPVAETSEEPAACETCVECESPAPAVEETAAEEPLTETVAEENEADSNGTISFALGQQQTIDEKYYALSPEERGWYDEIIKYASTIEGSKRFKNARYEEYKVGKNRIVRMLIKRGVINCEFILHNSDFKNYVNENKISVRQSATTMLVENAATVAAVKNSIDIVVASIAEEKEYKKQLARERRRAARISDTSKEKEDTKTTVGAE